MPPPKCPKEMAAAVARHALHGFLDAGVTLDLAPRGRPVVTALILTHNRAEVTLACFQSLAARLNRTPVEVVVLDNASSDETPELLTRTRGITVLRSDENVGFPRGVNMAAEVARGDYLLLLNNDTEVLGRGIDTAVEHLATNPTTGAVGGRLILLDGTLQEAGCVVWRDGWVDLYGRGCDPSDPAFAFAREVDHVSAAFMLTPRRTFEDLGGLDERYSPGYFEDIDYSVRLWKAGKRVVYLPGAVTLHYESATSAGVLNVKALAQKHHAVFAARHADWLKHQPVRAADTLPYRQAADATVKVFALANGSVPAAELAASVKRLRAAGGFVTVGLLGAVPATGLKGLAAALPGSELVPLGEAPAVARFLRSRGGYFDLGIAVGDVDARLLDPLRTEGLRVLGWDGRRAA